MTKLNWDKTKRPKPEPTPPKGRGITNAQARELARLQRRADEMYTGRGATARSAARTIQLLRNALILKPSSERLAEAARRNQIRLRREFLERSRPP